MNGKIAHELEVKNKPFVKDRLDFGRYATCIQIKDDLL